MAREQISVDHPDDDVLADLAADALPIDQARMVEAHVLSCRTCTDLLADAESVRGMLLAQRPTSIPPQIAAQLDRAVAAEVAARSAPGTATPHGEQSHGGEPRWMADAPPAGGTGWTAKPPEWTNPPAAAPVPIGGMILPDHMIRAGSPVPEDNPFPGAQPAYETGAQPAYETGAQPAYETGAQPAYEKQRREPRSSGPPQRSASPAPPTPTRAAPERGAPAVPSRQPGWADDTWAGVPVDGQTSTFAMPAVRDGSGHRPQRGPLSARVGRGSSRTRRQAREEDRDDRLLGRRGTILAVAASGIVIAAIGLFVVRPMIGDGDGSTTAADISSKAPVTGSIAAPVLSTGTVYTDTKFAEQARQLVVEASHRKGAALGNASAVPNAQETAGAGRAAPSGDAQSAATPGDTSLKNATELRSCLDALSTDPASLVAVDLARFGEQDAAIIVIQSSSGGYEVWAVARNCSPEADGTMKFQVVPESAG